MIWQEQIFIWMLVQEIGCFLEKKYICKRFFSEIISFQKES
ncbi:hypothetical protein HMPREF1869_01764 [Bacteroidales bacterium KA00251]|nr:hypothetical protein HMPREF1869_01764 [Bacteroidales bacterium KA00251]